MGTAGGTRWARDARSADEMVAEARRAFFVVFGLVALVWALQVANWASDNGLAQRFGTVPHDPARLPTVLTAPFLHFGWEHLQANSGPLFVFGFLAAYRGVARFLGLTLLVALTSGLAVWVFQGGDTLGVGSSGLVFGFFGYVVLRGLFDRRLVDTLIGVVMAASFAYLLTTAVPGTPGVSWLAHLGGLLGGALGAFWLRDRAGAGGPAAPGTAGPAAVPAQSAPRGEVRKSGLF
ncbi:rhomboid family intramembrane serine protease [Streptomyces sp. BI20]|uniref:rhomboid family intramembrane serine protease n=1 Tax=Streptomyces sp. BI20 TaxID=3403460 RepID=UPI003C73F135